MGYILVIAEKPDMGTKYAAALGGVILSNGQELTSSNLNKYEKTIKSDRFKNGYFEGIAKRGALKGERIIYSWCFGHIASLFDVKDYDESSAKWNFENFPYVPETFKRKIAKDFEKHFKNLKSLMTSSDCELIVNGTDADREGELIFDDVYVLSASKKPVKRLWLNETNENGIIDALNSLKDYKDMEYLRDSARARSYSDWLVGINFTVLSTLMFGGGDVISIGRVQTPTLNIIVQREKEILDFKPETFFEVEGMFNKGLDYKGIITIDKSTKLKSEDEVKEILALLKSKKGIIKQITTEEKKELPPMFYDLGALQGDANIKYGFTLKKTLDTVQSLYEKGILSYPRTNCRTIPPGEKDRLNKIPSIIEEIYPEYAEQIKAKGIRLGSRYIKESSEAHFAIIPVGKPDIDKLSEDEKKIFTLVVKSIIASFLGDATWSQTKLITEVDGYEFYTTGKTLIIPGFREILPPSKEEPTLPILKKDDEVNVVKIEMVKKQTKPPQRYTEKTLKDAMEGAGKIINDEDLKEAIKDSGIGTPATRADIVERLIKVKYIERSGKSIKPTEKGMWLINNLPIEEIKHPEMTGKWELRLNNMAKKTDYIEHFMKDITAFVISNCDKLKKADKIINKTEKTTSSKEIIGLCPICKSPMYESEKSYYCSNWKSGCKGTIWKAGKDGKAITYGGKKLTKTMVKQLLSKGETGEITLKTIGGKEYKDKLHLVINDGYVSIKTSWQLKKSQK